MKTGAADRFAVASLTDGNTAYGYLEPFVAVQGAGGACQEPTKMECRAVCLRLLRFLTVSILYREYRRFISCVLLLTPVLL